MSDPVVVVALCLLIAAAYGAAAWRVYRRARGTRLIHCPRTGTAAYVELDAVRAAALVSPDGALTVRRCSLWPERGGCAQWCCDTLDASNHACRAWDVFAQWYVGKRCSLCHRDIPRVEWAGLTPGLLSPRGRIVEWADVPEASIFDVLATHKPVCIDCDVVAKLRRQLTTAPTPPPAA